MTRKRPTLLLQLKENALSAVGIVEAAVDVDSGAVVIVPLALLPQFDHGCGCESVRVRVVVVAVVSFVDGYIEVRQVELDDGLWVSGGDAHTLDPFPHHGALGLLQENRGIYKAKGSIRKKAVPGNNKCPE